MKKKILFYCQHLLGVGHLSRSFAICEALAREFEVTFIHGGPKTSQLVPHNINMHYLDPILMRESNNQLFDPLADRDIGIVFSQRAKQIENICDSKFDVVITELFPFGRKKFKQEIINMVLRLKDINPTIEVCASVRDVLVEKQNSIVRDQQIAETVNLHYDHVFIHSDQKLIPFEKSFSALEQIRDKVLYTGFVTENKDLPTELERRRQILVSIGGGRVGFEVFEAVANIIEFYKEYRFKFVCGPYLNARLKNGFKAQISSFENAEIFDFLQNFEEELLSSALSISLGGYNTTMNLLRTRTPALVFPYEGDCEQRVRAEVLAKIDCISVLNREDLCSEKLRRKINHRLGQDFPAIQFDLSGALQTTSFISHI